ncbi:hypothetical protein PAMP_012812 [Pampus punctatissimus]
MDRQQQQQKEGEDRYLPVDTGSSGDQGHPPSLDDPQNVGPVPLGPWPPDTWIGRDQGPFAPQTLNPPPCSSGSRPYPLHTTPPGTPPPSYSPALSPTFAPLFTSSPQSDTDDGPSTTPPSPSFTPFPPSLSPTFAPLNTSSSSGSIFMSDTDDWSSTYPSSSSSSSYSSSSSSPFSSSFSSSSSYPSSPSSSSFSSSSSSSSFYFYFFSPQRQHVKLSSANLDSEGYTSEESSSD